MITQFHFKRLGHQLPRQKPLAETEGDVQLQFNDSAIISQYECDLIGKFSLPKLMPHLSDTVMAYFHANLL